MPSVLMASNGWPIFCPLGPRHPLMPSLPNNKAKHIVLILFLAGGGTFLILSLTFSLLILAPDEWQTQYPLIFADLFQTVLLVMMFFMVCPWLTTRFMQGKAFPSPSVANTNTQSRSFWALTFKNKCWFILLHLCSAIILLPLIMHTMHYWRHWHSGLLLLLSTLPSMMITMSLATLYRRTSRRWRHTPDKDKEEIGFSWAASTSLVMALAVMAVHMIYRAY